jgi:hypothetical protein
VRAPLVSCTSYVELKRPAISCDCNCWPILTVRAFTIFFRPCAYFFGCEVIFLVRRHVHLDRALVASSVLDLHRLHYPSYGHRYSVYITPLAAKYTCPGCPICPHPSIFCVPLSSRNLSAFDAATFLLPLPEFAFTEYFFKHNVRCTTSTPSGSFGARHRPLECWRQGGLISSHRLHACKATGGGLQCGATRSIHNCKCSKSYGVVASVSGARSGRWSARHYNRSTQAFFDSSVN